MVKRNVFYFISLACVWFLLGVSCDVGETGADYVYFLFNRYYVPSKVLQGFSSGSYDVTLYGTFYFQKIGKVRLFAPTHTNMVSTVRGDLCILVLLLKNPLVS